MDTSLYNPVIVKKEVDDQHYYFVDGIFYPSVTKIISETLPTPLALRIWLGDVGNERAQQKLDKAADRGTRIHEACQRLILGETIQLNREFRDKADKKCLVGFINWFEKYQPKPLVFLNTIFKPEMIVASKFGYAGTMDYICEIDGKPYIIDYKTSAGVYDSHKLQITAYQYAVKEMYGIDCQRGILHLTNRNKNGYTFYDDDKMVLGDKNITISDFLTVMDMYKMLSGGKFPEPTLTEVYPDILRLEYYDNVLTN